jgi:ribosomal protein S18 acetylase RimI-like enzyme
MMAAGAASRATRDPGSSPTGGPEIRDLRPDDLEGVVAIDALRTGTRKPEYWARVFRETLDPDPTVVQVGLAAERGGILIGYVTGEIRAFEFGSEACGWILTIGVDPARAREKIATSLLAAACRRFQKAGVTKVRTMVQRADVPVLSFFRANGFVGGSFVQMELDLPGTAGERT